MYATEGKRPLICEVGPRDGLQNESVVLPIELRRDLIQRCLWSGHTRLEVVSFVDPRRVPAMSGAEELLSTLPQSADVVYEGLVLNRRGFDRAQDAGISAINIIVVATDTFSRRNQGMTTRDMLSLTAQMLASAASLQLRSSVTIAAAFGCPFTGQVDPGWVESLAGEMAAMGADEVALADTIGVATPRQVRELVTRITRAIPDVPLRAHFHNTRNTGYANAVAALESGVATLDASVGGIGGCPFAPNATGNIATEDLVYCLEGDGLVTGLDLEELMRTAAWVGQKLGRQIPGLVHRAGSFP